MRNPDWGGDEVTSKNREKKEKSEIDEEEEGYLLISWQQKWPWDFYNSLPPTPHACGSLRN